MPFPPHSVSTIISSIKSIVGLMEDDFDIKKRLFSCLLLNFKKEADASKNFYREQLIIYESIFVVAKWNS